MPQKSSYRDVEGVALRREIRNAPDKLEEVLRKGNDGEQTWLYPFVVRFLSQLELDPMDAQEHFYRIQGHMAEMDARLGRSVGIRVALLDYFHNVAGKIVNPRIIEHQLLETLIEKTKEDPKTGCCNGEYFIELVRTELMRANRYEQKCSLILLDIDDFKKINDNYGHLCGDEVLRNFTDVLQKSVRVEDNVGRYGGDEFTLLLPQTGRVGARCLAERVRAALADFFAAFTVNGETIKVTFSGGIATYPYDGNSYEELIEVADTGLYRSKAIGKNFISDNLNSDDVRGLGFAEKRVHRRFRPMEDRKIEINNAHPLVNLKAKVVNISTGGILLECNPLINEEVFSDALRLRIPGINGNEQSVLELQGKVVRLTQNNGSIRLAVSFDNKLQDDVWDGLVGKARLLPA